MRFERCKMLLLIETLFEQSPKNYANAMFSSVECSRDLSLLWSTL